MVSGSEDLAVVMESNERRPQLRRLVPGEVAPSAAPPSQPRASQPAPPVPVDTPTPPDSHYIVAGIGCVLVLIATVIIGGVLGMRYIDGDKASPSPAPAVVAADLDPTATIVAVTPTPTMVPAPSPTPWPTATPFPTAADAPAMPPVYDYRGNEEAYRAEVGEISEFLIASIDEVEVLFEDPQPADAMWTYKTGIQIGTWQGLYEWMLGVVPPDRYQEFNVAFVKALANLDNAAGEIIYAFDYDEAGSLESGRAKMQEGSQQLQDALTLLHETV